MPCCAPWDSEPVDRDGSCPTSRRRVGSGPRVPWVPLLAFLLLPAAWWTPTVARGQDAEAAYRQGIEAVDAEDWATVVTEMTRALEQRPASGGRRVKIYGMRFEDYTPYFHLGRAKERLGDCPAALAAWQQVDPKVLGNRLKAELEADREQCRRRAEQLDAARVQTPQPAPPEPVEPAEPRQADAKPPGREASPWADGPPPAALRGAATDFLAHRYGSALAQLENLPPGADGLDAPAKQATVHLLKAACRYALWRLGAGGRGPEAAQPPAQIRAEIRAAKALAPELRPSPFWFSPGFRALFDTP